ncbi:hypothetical protein [uncultured Marinobacter sp.]|uniref:hypothetical protein n=1 Tax=uncultured Marinobacter sp. TaxID=187379 RepID=UPI0026396034|nr:hypothetical protein [uncultured Marinobacter sp.]
MSDQSSLLVEKLWQLKRRIDKGECPDIAFVHLNNLLREPGYRSDVLRRVESSGSERLKRLAEDIRALDSGGPLMATTAAETIESRQPATQQKPQSWLRRNLIWMMPSTAAAAIAAFGFTAFEPQTIRVHEDIVSDAVWESGKTYVLEKSIFVEGADLTLESGVTVKGDNGSALIVTRGSKLFSRGRPDSPVVFTSNQPEGQRARGDWGGVVVLGKAPVNQPDAGIEGISANDSRGAFGGNDARYSCGVIEYTRIEFAGFEVYKNNELNGLTLGGCGSDTIVRNVQVHRALDDGIEMFGGSVDLKNIVVTGAADDSIDWDWGWTGRVQFLVVQQHPDVGDNAFEGDNNGNDHQARPRSEPWFYNVTLVGTGQTAKKHRGMVLREGTGGHFHNMIIDSYGIEAVDLRDEISSLIGNGRLTFSNNLIANTGKLGKSTDESGSDNDDFGFSEGQWLAAADQDNVRRLDSALHVTARDPVDPDFQTRVQMRQMKATQPPKSEFFDESANYAGALNPRLQSSWLDSWTAYPES